MSPGPLQSLLDSLFGDAAGVSPTGSYAHEAAELAAGLSRGEIEPEELADNPDHSVVRLAAYLDGALDETTQQELHGRLSRSPALLHDVMSADAFLDATLKRHETAPVDIVAATLARGRPTSTSTSSARRSSRIWTWSGVVVAMAAAAVVAMIIVSRHAVPTDSTVPATASNAPAPQDAPGTSKLAQPQPSGGIPTTPVLAGKETQHPPVSTILPAAGPDTVPKAKMPKPIMAPESFDTAPGGQKPR